MTAIYVNNNIDSFGVLVHKNIYSFKTRLGATTNLLIQCIVCFTINLALVPDGRRYLISKKVNTFLCVLYTSLYHMYKEFYILK